MKPGTEDGNFLENGSDGFGYVSLVWIEHDPKQYYFRWMF